MQGNGYDHIELSPAYSFVVQRGIEPSTDKVLQMHLTSILKLVDDASHNPTTAVNGDGGLKVEPAMGAVGASKNTAHRPEEGLGASRAKGRRNARRLGVAIIAEIFTSLNAAQTNRAHRRIKKRAQRPEQFKVC